MYGSVTGNDSKDNLRVCWTKDHIQLRSKVKLRLTPVTSVWLFHATSHSKVVCVTPAKKDYDLQMISWKFKYF